MKNIQLSSDKLFITEEVFNEYLNSTQFYLGEIDLGHKLKGMIIHLVNASHTIENLYLRDGVIYGDVKFLDTPCGKILKFLHEVNYPIEFYVTGTCVKENDKYIVTKIIGINAMVDTYKTSLQKHLDKKASMKFYQLAIYDKKIYEIVAFRDIIHPENFSQFLYIRLLEIDLVSKKRCGVRIALKEETDIDNLYLLDLKINHVLNNISRIEG